MIKTLLIIGILLISVSIGGVINNYFSNRVKVYKEFCSIIQSIKLEISFLKTNKLIILKNIQYCNKQVNRFMCDYIKNGIGEMICLKEEENQGINQMLNSIGKSDVEGELNNLQYYEALIFKKYQEAQEKCEKYGTFSIKISIILGVLIAIILL